MKFKKVVYVRYIPLTKAIYTDLYFEALMQNNVQVDYVDLTSLFFPYKINSDDFDFSGTIKINSYKNLEDYLKNQNNQTTLYISIMTFEWRLFKLYRLFTSLNIYLAVFARGVFPNNAEPDHKTKILRTIKTINFKRVINFGGSKITSLSKKYGFIKPYDYVFKAGELGYHGIGVGSEIDLKKSKLIEVNTVDYDQFLLHSELSSLPKTEYIVFLDQYLPYHPDASYFNIKTVDPERYFKEVNNFFDRLELATGKKVIIAAHPKAEKYKEFNPFNNRPLFINQSNDLVRDAAFVLTHASTAVCFPICYQKKIVLILSDYLNEILPHFIVAAQSIVQSCGASMISMDKNDDVNIIEQLDFGKYNDFKYKYLTSQESENQLSVNIFINFIKMNHAVG